MSFQFNDSKVFEGTQRDGWIYIPAQYDGSKPAERVLRMGYRFRATGENIAAGPSTPEGAVAGWLKDAANDDVKGDLDALQKHLADPERKHFRELPVKTPHDIDLLWGNFYITGEYEPVSAILDVFDRPDDKETAVLRRVGKFSLGSNLQRHPKLVELVQKHRPERGAGADVDDLAPTLGIKSVLQRKLVCMAAATVIGIDSLLPLFCGSVLREAVHPFDAGQLLLEIRERVLDDSRRAGQLIAQLSEIVRGMSGAEAAWQMTHLAEQAHRPPLILGAFPPAPGGRGPLPPAALGPPDRRRAALLGREHDLVSRAREESPGDGDLRHVEVAVGKRQPDASARVHREYGSSGS
jgi:hypothetical protein